MNRKPFTNVTESPEPSLATIPRDEAIEILLSTDEIDLEPGDADHALTRLIDRGYLYEVDSELRVTQPPAEI